MSPVEPSSEAGPPSPGSTLSPGDYLPPVEPPSARFIVQLFVVPAIIVAAVIGLYLLFGRLAARDVDWRRLVIDIRSANHDVKWRAALELAEALDADAPRGEQGQQLAQNPEIAAALSELAAGLLAAERSADQEQQLQFVLKALGRLDLADAAWPPLRDALAPKQPVIVRKHALQAVAMIAGRQRERGATLEIPGLVSEIVDSSTEPDPVLRQHAAFTLGLLPGEESLGRLTVLLSDSDPLTRVNAAIALARESNPLGLAVLEQSVAEALSPAAGANSQEPAANAAFERQVILRNSIAAIVSLGPRLSADDRQRLDELLARCETTVEDGALRLQAKEARMLLGRQP